MYVAFLSGLLCSWFFGSSFLGSWILGSRLLGGNLLGLLGFGFLDHFERSRCTGAFRLS